MVKITIIIPNYNRRDDILENLKSVYQQEFKDFEVIVIDDFSSDDSVKKIKEKFPKTKVFSLKKNVGPAVARNYGIKKAKGNIIVGIDSDEVFKNKNCLKEIQSKFDKDKKESILAFRTLDYFKKDEDLKSCWWHPRPIEKYADKEFYTDYFGAGIVAFRKVVFEKAGLYPEELFIGGEENDLLLRILDAGFDILYYPKAQILHKEHDRSTRYAYYKRRNQLWIAIKYFPFWKGFFYITPRIIKSLFTSIGEGNLKEYLKGLYDGIKGIPQELKLRKPLKKETWTKIKLIRQGKYNPETFKKENK